MPSHPSASTFLATAPSNTSADDPRSSVNPVVAATAEVRLRVLVRGLRGERSLKDAAALIGINRDELGRIERGESKQIRFDTLSKLLSAYRCTLADLFEVERIAPPSAQEKLYAGAMAALDTGILTRGVRRRAVIREEYTGVAEQGDGVSSPPA